MSVCLKSYGRIKNVLNARLLCKLRFIRRIEDHLFVRLDQHTPESLVWTIKQARFIEKYGEEAWKKTANARGYRRYKITSLID